MREILRHGIWLAAALAGGVAAMGQVAASAQAASMHGGCGNYTADLSNEMRLMTAETVDVKAGTDAGNAPMGAVGRAMEVHLASQAAVHLAAAPAQDRGGAERKAGLVGFEKLEAGDWRVSVDRFVWIDLVRAGELLESGAFQMESECPALFKTVVFHVPEATPVVLELTGASDQAVRVLLTRAK